MRDVRVPDGMQLVLAVVGTGRSPADVDVIATAGDVFDVQRLVEVPWSIFRIRRQ